MTCPKPVTQQPVKVNFRLGPVPFTWHSLISIARTDAWLKNTSCPWKIRTHPKPIVQIFPHNSNELRYRHNMFYYNICRFNILNWIQNVKLSACVTLIFYGWHRKTIGHLFYTTLNFLIHFKALRKFKLELQSGNPRFGSILVIFCHVWTWNLMDNIGKQHGTSLILCHAFCIVSKPCVNSNGLQSGNA